MVPFILFDPNLYRPIAINIFHKGVYMKYSNEEQAKRHAEVIAQMALSVRLIDDIKELRDKLTILVDSGFVEYVDAACSGLHGEAKREEAQRIKSQIVNRILVFKGGLL
jgi:hypothetical protein